MLSTGGVIANPHSLEQQLRTLRRLNRQLARGKAGSKRRKQIQRKVARVHARAAYVRRDAIHKLTTTLTTARPTQAALVDYLQHGGYDRHLRQLRRTLREREQTFAQPLTR